MNKRQSFEVVHLDGKKEYFELMHRNLDEFEQDDNVSHLLIIAFKDDGRTFSTRTNIKEEDIPPILEGVANVIRSSAKNAAH